jgi:ubiquinone biosynthesis protein
MQALIDAVQTNDRDALEQYAQKGIIPDEIAPLVLQSTLTQMFRFRVFHADPHAANLVILEGGALAYLDFGIVGWLDEQLWAQQFKVRRLVAAEKIHAAYEAILITLEPLPLHSLPSFEREVKGLIRDWILASSNPFATVLEKSSGYFFLRLFDAIRRAQLTIPFTVMNLYRTMIIADIVMLAVDPKIDWLPELKRFVNRETKRQTHLALKEHYSTSNLNNVFLMALNSQTAITELLEWLQYRLPEVSRGFKYQLSRLEQLSLMFFVYFRFGLFILLLVVLGGQIIPFTNFFSGETSQFVQSLDSNWWLWSVSTFVGMIILSRFINMLKRPE